MIFFDTNILIYFTINQDAKKQELSKKLIKDAIKQNNFFISPLVMSEYIYILAKFKMLDVSREKIEFFNKISQGEISSNDVNEAYKLCSQNNFCRNINDTIHLKIAEQHCTKLITFDKDFKKLQSLTDLQIEILNA